MRAIILLLLLAACSTEPIVMVNTKTGETRQCGPYSTVGLRSMTAPEREAQCIRDYKEEGYVRQ